MNDEIESIEKNDTWELVDLPKNKDCIGVKQVYKTKFKANGDVDKYKARFVAKGFLQEYGVDYNEKFAPTTRLDTVIIYQLLQLKTNGWFTKWTSKMIKNFHLPK